MLRRLDTPELVAWPTRSFNRSASRLLRTATCLFFLSMASISVAATDLPQRLQNLSAAVDAYTATQAAADAKRFPASLRRVTWLYLDNDRLADAVVVLKARKSECAVTAEEKRLQCRALIVRQIEDGNFKVVFDLPLLWHPLLIKPQTNEPAQLYVSDSSLEEPDYSRYDFNGTTFSTAATAVARSDARQVASFEFDDRSMPLIESQILAASRPENLRARMSPYSLLIDNINPGTVVSNALSRSLDEQFLPRLLAPMQDDLSKVVGAIGWPMSLEVRLLGCPDWPVLRRFWEVEGTRTGKLAVCVSGMAFWDSPAVATLQASRTKPLPSLAERVDAMRYRVMHEIGTAFVLRAYPMAVASRQGLRELGNRRTLTVLSAGMAMLIGQELRIETPEQALRAHALWESTAQLWFDVYEAGEQGWTTPTPELQAFVSDLVDRRAGLDCARRIVGKSAGPGPCPESVYKLLINLQANFRSTRGA